MVTSSDSYLCGRLVKSGAQFHHAINLREFAQYCRLGGVLGRAILMAEDPDFTRFWSDDEDQKKGALSRVFGNLYDFGAIFARAGQTAIPNIYGPISLIFRPEAFEHFSDIVVTKQSIAMHGENWRDAAILNKSAVDELLAGDKFGSPIGQPYQYSEVSCAEGILPLKYLDKILVDPLVVEGKNIVEKTSEIAKKYGCTVTVESRAYRRPSNLENLQSLCDALRSFMPNPPRIHTKLAFTTPPAWIASSASWPKSRLEIWISYFYNGTACFLREDG